MSSNRFWGLILKKCLLNSIASLGDGDGGRVGHGRHGGRGHHQGRHCGKNTELTSKSGSPLDRIFRYLCAHAVWLIRGAANWPLKGDKCLLPATHEISFKLTYQVTKYLVKVGFWKLLSENSPGLPWQQDTGQQGLYTSGTKRKQLHFYNRRTNSMR